MVSDLLAEGLGAFEDGRWSAAVEALSGVSPLPPDAAEALGKSRWWLDDPGGAIAAWEAAYVGYLEERVQTAAARVAVSIAREYIAAFGNDVAGNGWIQRARDALRDEPPDAARGWIELAEAERTAEPSRSREHAETALAVARAHADRALEINALARIGTCDVRLGHIDEGMSAFDGAMAAATGGEGQDPRLMGDVFCGMVEACMLAADTSRVERWLEVFNDYMQRYEHPPLLSFCMVCDAEDQLRSGRWSEAEQTLIAALAPIEAGAQRSRCIHPAALLTQIRVSQGRFEEADQLVAGLESLPEMTVPRASLFLARGESAVAVAELHRRLNAVGRENLLATPLLGLLVEAELAHGDVAAAAKAANELQGLASGSERPRDDVDAALAAGLVASAEGRATEAREQLERALAGYGTLEMPFDAARTRLAIARLVRAEEPALAVEEARVAMTAFDRIGAVREADTAASVLRELGATGRTGPRQLERLTKREREVLGLLGQGLTNAEIAARLFISTKTAAHHVSSVLAKLGMRNRAEAAAYAQRFLERSAPV